MVDIDDKKFSKEVRCLMMAKHRNIVRFLGYCSDTQGEMMNYEGELVLADVRQRLLCFEYLSQGSLDKQITGRIDPFLHLSTIVGVQIYIQFQNSLVYIVEL